MIAIGETLLITKQGIAWWFQLNSLEIFYFIGKSIKMLGGCKADEHIDGW